MKSIFLGLVILLGSQILSQNVFAELQAFVDRSTILESQTIEFTLRSSSKGDPDFSDLEKHFTILGSRTNSQYQSINGRVSSWIDWNLTLEPNSTGKLTIPAISINADSSEPITIQINALDPSLRAAIQSLVFFESQVSADNVYVQAQLIFTRKLYYVRGAQLYGESPGTPDIEHAVVKSLAPVAPVSIEISGRPYTLIEQKYAIFPERSGTLTIPAVAASGNVRLRAQPGFVGGRTRIRAVSESLDITVKPIPAAYPASKPWLPASEVIIVDAWSDQTDGLVVGVPITRVLMVQAQASIGSAIPPLKPEFPKALRAYPQAPVISEQAIPDGLTGLRKEEYSISAQRSGGIRLPEIEITWWDTDTDEVQVARLPEQTIQVALNPAAPNLSNSGNPEKPIEVRPLPQVDQAPPEKERIVTEDKVSTWPRYTIPVAIVILLMTILFFSRRYLTFFAENPETARERKLFNELKSCDRNQDLKLFKSQLTEWLGVAYQLPQNRALQVLAIDVSSRQKLQALNRGIYAAEQNSKDNTRIITEIIDLAKQQRDNRKPRQPITQNQRKDLPELFPIG